MPFQKGRQKTGGRKPGVVGQYTRTIKDVFESVFVDLQTNADADYNLLAWAKKNPTEFYKLAARLIPIQLNNRNDSEVVIHVNKTGRENAGNRPQLTQGTPEPVEDTAGSEEV